MVNIVSAAFEEVYSGAMTCDSGRPTGEVAAHREDHKTIYHPSVGPVTVDCDILTDGDSELKIVIMTAVPGSEDETKLRLTAVAGPPMPTTRH
ncbi:MmyB family transcriptional regulator [Nonomuraea sp. NPDC003707]